jgi:hypothetical protein
MGWIRTRLSQSELRLWRAASNGDLLDLRLEEKQPADPAPKRKSSNRQAVHAEFLCRLLTDRQPSNSRAVKLQGARILGTFDVEAMTLTRALYLEGCIFDQPVNLADAKALSVRLHGCQMPSLNANRLSCRGNLEMAHGFQAERVQLAEARIGGSLLLDGARLENPGGIALNAWGITVEQSMNCGNGFVAHGQVLLGGARIGGTLAFTGSELHHPDGWALEAQSVKVGYALFLGSSIGDEAGFTAYGGIRLVGAQIDGFMCCWQAKLHNPGGCALSALGLSVREDILLSRGFTAVGQVDLDAVHVGSQLDFDGALLDNSDRVALSAERMHVGKSLMFRDRFTAIGSISLVDTRVDGSLDFTNSLLDGCPELSVASLQARSMIAHFGTSPLEVDLRHAKVAVFTDDPMKGPETLRLWNFTYDQLDDMSEASARNRLRWLRRDRSGYLPQPYEQLALAYRRAGREQAARQTAIAKLWHQRETLNFVGKAWNWLLYLTVGYGYRTWLAGLWLLALLIVGSQIFDHAYPDAITPTRQPSGTFNPYAYAAEALIPVLNLGQRSAWQLSGTVAYFSWLLTVAGWVLTTAVVAGLSRVFRRE